MRATLLAICFACWAACAAQGDGKVLLSAKPDAWITVKKSNVGVDYVTVKMLLENYSAELLKKQCQAVGKYAKGAIRGLSLTFTPTGSSPGGKPGKILQAEFAVDGLINQEKGILDLNPIAKAFTGPEVDVLAVMFESQPLEGVTLRSWSGASADVVGQYDATVHTVEYRVTLKTRDPAAIDIPLTAEKQTNPVQTPSNVQPGTNLIPWVAGGAILAGVLVYFALRPYSKRRD